MILSRSIPIFLIVLLISCNQKSKNNLSAVLNQDHLPSQIFTVDINRDTILMTKNGSIIKLPKGSLESNSNNVKLEIKEALSLTDMVLAGLTTMSGQNALSSGGMIYFNAAEGFEVTIKKDIEVLLPTKNYNPDMQVFKGDKESDGSIDWKDPVLLPPDETLTKISAGEEMFKANCANCHKVNEQFTGPPLTGITERRPKQWLYDFTRNPAQMIAGDAEGTNYDSSNKYAHGDIYSQCIFNEFKPALMTSFQQLTDADLDAIYSYVKTESVILPDLLENYGYTCCDSCEIFGKALDAASSGQETLQNEEELFNLDRVVTIPVMEEAVLENLQSEDTTIRPYTKVYTTQMKATYYTINIQATGWYNIDILLKEFTNCVPSELFVRVQGSYNVELTVVLVIPSIKAFIRGGKLKDGKMYGFDENDGRIPLPQNARSYILAFAEYGDKVVFGNAEFSTQLNQTIEITMSEISKSYMEFQIKKMDLEGINMQTDKINVDTISIITPSELSNPDSSTKELPVTKAKGQFDKKMDEVMRLNPKNCDCGFLR